MDEQGEINWHAAWRKELAQLQQATEEQEKAGADQEWYKNMLIRVRTAMMAPPMGLNPAGEPLPPPPPHGMPGQPPNLGDVQVQVSMGEPR